MNIRNLLAATAAVCVFTALALCTASAQGNIPCVTNPPDCAGDAFVLQPTITLTLWNGCEVKVIYRVRCACGFYNDVAIEQISIPNTPECNGMLPQEILDQVANILIAEVLAVNPPCGGTIPNCPATAEHWRVLRAPCVYVVDVDGTRLVFACDGSACCWRVHSVCNAGPFTVTTVSTQQATSCPNSAPNGGQCYPTCQ